MSKGINEDEKEYIIYNIDGFFKHHKLEERIKKFSDDIHKLQKLRLEINNDLIYLSSISNKDVNNNNNNDKNTNNILTKSASSLAMVKKMK
jgi:hypothetical protein